MRSALLGVGFFLERGIQVGVLGAFCWFPVCGVGFSTSRRRLRRNQGVGRTQMSKEIFLDGVRSDDLSWKS
jgi:hypothetical protein